MDLSAEAKERILSGTALEWLGLDRADYETDASRAHSAGLAGIAGVAEITGSGG